MIGTFTTDDGKPNYYWPVAAVFALFWWLSQTYTTRQMWRKPTNKIDTTERYVMVSLYKIFIMKRILVDK